VVPNGLPLSKIHHAAFDAHLIGIDPDYRLHFRSAHDGPMLEAIVEHVHDPYKTRLKLAEPTVCPKCGALFHEGRWRWPSVVMTIPPPSSQTRL